jgi:hypothetical protein
MMHDKKAKPAKRMMAGGMMKKGYAAGGAMPMKDGKPAFVGDGKGKMAAGGMAKKGYQAGGVMDEEEMMGRMGRGMAKATMQKKAMKEGGIAKAIKKHETSSPVHKAGLKAGGATKKMMAGGGMTKKMQAGGGVTRGDGIVKKGRTQGKMI